MYEGGKEHEEKNDYFYAFCTYYFYFSYQNVQTKKTPEPAF